MFYNKLIKEWSLQEIFENFEDWIYQGCTERDKEKRDKEKQENDKNRTK